MTILKLIEKQDEINVKKLDKLLEEIELKARDLREKIKSDEYKLHKNLKQFEVEANDIINKDTSLIIVASSLGMFFDEIAVQVRQQQGINFEYLAALMVDINTEIVTTIRDVQEIEDRFEE